MVWSSVRGELDGREIERRAFQKQARYIKIKPRIGSHYGKVSGIFPKKLVICKMMLI